MFSQILAAEWAFPVVGADSDAKLSRFSVERLCNVRPRVSRVVPESGLGLYAKPFA